MRETPQQSNREDGAHVETKKSNRCKIGHAWRIVTGFKRFPNARLANTPQHDSRSSSIQ